MSQSNEPLPEQWHAAALACADAEAAAQILEESRTSVLAERVSSLLKADPKLSIARAETEVRASIPWHDYIEGMVRARTKANKLRVERDYIRMKFQVWISETADHRIGARL